AVGTDKDRLLAGLGKHLVLGAEVQSSVLRVAIQLDRTGNGLQARGEFDELAAWHVIHSQLALLLCKGLPVLPVPANHHPVAPQHGASFAGEESFVCLVSAVRAMPGVGRLAFAIADAIKTEEDAAVMRRVDVGIIGQTASGEKVALGRKKVMEYLVSP